MGLLAYLRAHCPSYPSVKGLKRAIDQKQCKINGRVECFSTHPLRVGDLIELNFSSISKEKLTQVLYEDERLIAYNKPPYVISEPPNGLFSVHRLDKETSGVLLFAKTLKAQTEINYLFKTRQVIKGYLAIVDGVINKKQWTSDNFLGKKQVYQGGVIYGLVPPHLGKRALTHFRCLQATKGATLLFCEPVTGRTHQIRAQLKAEGHPVLGDWQYSKKFNCSYESKRHLLHACTLSIAGLNFVAPLFEDFIAACADLFNRKEPILADLLHG